MARKNLVASLLSLAACGVGIPSNSIAGRYTARAMKFGDPILTSELSGSLGGVVASSSRGGLGYFRVRARPGNPRTQFQMTARAVVTGLASAWTTTLTDLQRAGWESISSGGSSGINTYVKANEQRVLGGVARIDGPPSSIALPNLPFTDTPAVDASAHTVTVAVPSAETLTECVNVFITRKQHTSRLSRQFNYTYAGTADDVGGGDTATINIPVGHPAYNLAAGDIVYVRIVPFSATDSTDPKVGLGQEFRCTVVA